MNVIINVVPAQYPGRTIKTRFGVGEVLALSVTVRPAAATIASVGGIEIKVGGVQGSTVTAVNLAMGTATLTLGAQAGSVKLEAWGQTPVRKSLATKTITVVAPTELSFTKHTGCTINHAQDTASAGFIADIEVKPFGVWFGNIEVREGAFNSVGSGAFAQFAALPHPNGPWSGVSCTALTSWRNQWLGTDMVDSGTGAPRIDPNTQLVMVDGLGRDIFEPGTFEWNIPWHFRLVGQGGNGAVIFYAVHIQTVSTAGKVTIKKADSSVESANYADPTITFSLPAIGYP